MAKILTISEQLHVYKEIENLFEDLTKEQKETIINSLGLSDIFDGNGGLAPMYSLDIISDSEYFLNPGISHTINLSAKLYNYSNEISTDRVTEWRWTRISGDDSDYTWFKVSKNITITDEDLTNKIKDNFVSFICQATLDDGTKIYDTVKFSNSLTLSSVQIQSDSNMFLGNSPNKILFTAVIKGFTATQYSWFLNNTLVSTERSYDMPNSIIVNNSVGNLRLEVKDAKGNIHTDTVSVPKLKEARDGEPGVPGPIGPSGNPTYTWIKYADNEEGTKDFSEYPVKLDGSFRQYIGYAYNKESPLESDNPADYQWAKYIGDQGIPGENGYMWITYSQWPEGLDTNGTVDVSEDPYDEVSGEYMVYMGIAYNKQEQQEPNFNSMSQAEFKEVGFLWAKIKGEDGHTAYVIDLSNEVAGIPTDSDGKVISDTSYLGATGVLSLFYGNTIVPGSEWFADAVASDSNIKFSFQRDNNTGKYTFALTSINGLVSDSGSIVFTVKSQETNPKEIGKATFSFTKMKGIAAYNIVTSRSEIKVTPQTDGSVIIDPTKITVKVMKNTGTDYKETLEGSLYYRYSWDKTGDGNSFDPPTSNGTYTLNVSNANNPSHIEIFYYHPIVNNKIVDRETIPFVRDGQNGEPGPPGQPGKDGQPGPRGPFLAPRGNWNATAQYVGNNERLEAVLYNKEWYVTLNTAGNVPIGTLPINTTYWKKADQNFDFIATGLLLAQTAYIENLGVRSLRTNDAGQRVEILADDNTMKFYIDGKTNPSITMATGQGGNGNYAIESPVIEVRGKVKANENSDRTSFMSNSGVFSNASNMYFMSASSNAADNSASVVGLYQTEDEIDTPYLNSYRAGVVGINQMQTNTGRTFGGYFNTMYMGSMFRNIKTISASGNYYATLDCGLYFNPSTQNNSLYLPVMADAKTSNGTWNRGVAFEIEVLVGENAYTRVYSQNGADSMYGAGSTGTSIVTDRAGIWRFIWTGTQWFVIRYISYWK